MRDLFTHSPCNGLWLCRTCHTWVHANPFEARRAGLIVSRYESQPHRVPAKAHYGWVLLGDDGLYEHTTQPEGQ